MKLKEKRLTGYFRCIYISLLFLFADLPPVYPGILQYDDSPSAMTEDAEYEKILSLEITELFKELGSSDSNNLWGNIENDEHSAGDSSVFETFTCQRPGSEAKLPPQPTVAEVRQGFLYLLFLFSFILLFVFLFFRWKMRKAKEENVRVNKQLIGLQRDYMYLKSQYQRQGLGYRSKEISTKVECLLEKNNYVVSVIKQISELKNGNDDGIRAIIKQLKERNEEKIWEEFKVLAQKGHPNFYINLRRAHPDLSKNEERMCVFISLDMSTKDISSVTSQQIKTIEIARSRLRIKLDLKRGENLTSYIQQF